MYPNIKIDTDKMYVVRTKSPLNVWLSENTSYGWKKVHLIDWAYDILNNNEMMYNRHIMPSIRAWSNREQPTYITLSPPEVGNYVFKFEGKLQLEKQDIKNLKIIGVLTKLGHRWYCK